MPAKSESQRKFFCLIKGIQQGKISSKKVGDNVTKAAKSISSKDVEDFTRGKNLPKKKLNEIIDCIKQLKEDSVSIKSSPIYVSEEGEDTNTEVDINPIAKTFTQKGDFEQYIQRFSGLEIKPKEMDSINNYSNAKPTKVDKFSVRYESSDDFQNGTITVIKKLREGSNLVFTVFQKNSQQQSDDKKPSTDGEDIIINKSTSFRDEIEGGRILADLLQKLEI